MLCKTEQQEDIDSVVSLINRNKQIIKHLSIRISTTAQAINNIDSNKIDLKYLSINCMSLSLGSVVNLVQSPKMLRRLCLCHFDINESIGNFNLTPKVGILSRSFCEFRPKPFSQLIHLSKKLDTLRFCLSSFHCECVPIADKYNCKL
jgi:hypothetical protein